MVASQLLPPLLSCCLPLFLSCAAFCTQLLPSFLPQLLSPSWPPSIPSLSSPTHHALAPHASHTRPRHTRAADPRRGTDAPLACSCLALVSQSELDRAYQQVHLETERVHQLSATTIQAASRYVRKQRRTDECQLHLRLLAARLLQAVSRCVPDAPIDVHIWSVVNIWGVLDAPYTPHMYIL